MRSFAVSAIIAAAVNAVYYEYPITLDSVTTPMYYRNQDWS